ncbi:hypothetical protein [Microbacterium jiangjiandongii]|uniref:hypothetical protein n=1 Tax=Microbacterium jiangjiandongii TaxID=3049071 RepID=UPI00214C5E20|nr:hypothetical protein [Microbacterium sp. zg.Y843]MCR2816180.1 hypothetical protein [Microbacterium sp. zg.Y843]
MHWRAIGFDLDGTLFDHVGAAEEAVSEFVADLGCEPTADQLLQRHLQSRAHLIPSPPHAGGDVSATMSE